MVYQPEHHYLWDFWVAPRRSPDDPYHLFHLQAPRTIASPHDRHWVATVGHAVSRDLVAWEPRPTALGPGAPGAWDDMAIWTGCVVDHGGVYYLFYTGISTRERGRVQRIGVATSTDLETWERHPANPVLTADPRHYATLGPPPWDWEACRDPWVVADPDGDGFLLYHTANAAGLDHERAGVVGAARSADLVAWEPLPPVTELGAHGMLEVPQLVRTAGRWHLLYCTFRHTPAHLARAGSPGAWFGTHYLTGPGPRGPFRAIADDLLAADAAGTYYAGRVVEDGPDGATVFLAFRQWDPAGGFVGALSDPSPLIVRPDGSLSVDRARLWPG